MKVLVVIREFADYKVGHRITDEDEQNKAYEVHPDKTVWADHDANE